MSNYPEPDLRGTVFNSNDFDFSSVALTYALADARYFKLGGGVISGTTTITSDLTTTSNFKISNSGDVGTLAYAGGSDQTLTFPNQTATLATLADLPDSNDFVDLTTTQTIGGQKTFTSEIQADLGVSFNNGDSDILIQASGAPVGATLTLPNTSGTVALTSDLSNYTTLDTAQTITGTKTIQSDLIFDDGSANLSTFTGISTGVELDNEFKVSYSSTDLYLKNQVASIGGLYLENANASLALNSQRDVVVCIDSDNDTANSGKFQVKSNGDTITGTLLFNIDEDGALTSNVGGSDVLNIDSTDMSVNLPLRIEYNGGIAQLDSIDGTYAGLYGASTSDVLEVSTLGSVDIVIDNNNNSTTQLFTVRSNGVQGAGTKLMEITETGSTTIDVSGSTKLNVISNWSEFGIYKEGTFSSTLTAVSNITTITSPSTLTYTRIGRVVHCWLDCTIDPTATGQIRWSVSLPFTAVSQAIIGSNVVRDSNPQDDGRVEYNSATTVHVFLNTTSSVNQSFDVGFTYQTSDANTVSP